MVTKVTSSNFAPAVNSIITAAGAIPTISSITPTNNLYVATGVSVVDPASPFIKITGTNFSSNAQVYIDSTPATSVIFVSSTQLNVTAPSGIASGSYVVYVVNGDGSVAIRINGITYSTSPVWGTSSNLPGSTQGTFISIQLSAVSDSTVTYAVTSGSLPTGLTLSSSGLLSGTVTGLSAQTTYNFTITATDVENQTNASSFSITITVSDSYFYITPLLLNGETSVTPFINDASTNSFGLTIVGDTKANKFSPYYGDGYYSVYLSSTSPYLGFSQPALGNIFTIEMWVLPLSAGSNSYYYVGGSTTGPLIGYNGATFSVAHQGSWVLASSTAPTVNAWNHIALVREGTGTNQFKLYVNGVQTAVGTEATTFSAQTAGAIGGTAGSSQASYISNFRIVNNQALYTGAFTPATAPLTASSVGTTGANVAASLTGTTIIMAAQSASFIDKSASPLTLTPTNTPQVSPAIPFAAGNSYANYGSAYFDGSGDYLTIADNNNLRLGASDFCVEFWFYPLNTTVGVVLVKRINSSTYGSFVLDAGAGGGVLKLYASSTGSSYTISGATVGTYIINQWNHIAVYRSGSNWYGAMNGIVTTLATATSVTLVGTTDPWVIGGDIGANYMTANYSNLRIVIGSPIYTSSNFTPPTSPLTAVANTQLLTLQYNGGANNYGIIDNGPFQNILTRNGNTSQGSVSPYSQTGYSTYFDGTIYPGFLVNNVTSTLNFAAGQDFTMEFWVYSTSALADYYLINYGTYKEAYPSERVILITNKLASIYISAGSNTSATAYTVNYTTLTTNTWNHVAFVRYNNNITIYINGVAGNTTSAPGAAQPLSSRYDLAGPHGLWFGVNTTNWTGFSPVLFTGYMSNFRYVVGTALYTSNFTPSTTRLTAITNTQVLTHQNNRMLENSTNALAYTYNGTGTPSIQAWSPFATSGTYSPSTISGSAYFDGTGDYLTVPANPILTLGTSDYTVEVWIYLTGTQTTTYGWGIVGTYPGSGTGWSLTINRSTGGQGVAWIVGGAIVLGYTTAYIPVNMWTNIAITRSGTGTNNTKIFINGALATQGTDNTNDTFSGLTYIGGQGAAQYFTGYMSDLRVIKGYAAYTAAYTPTTTPLTSATATPASLLLNFTNGGIIDYHSGVVLETVGNTQLSTSVKKYGAASMSFNGSSQYLSTPYLPNFSTQWLGDSTTECWVYLNSVANTPHIWSMSESSSVRVTLYVKSSVFTLYTQVSTGGDIISSPTTLVTGQWYHIAITRSGTTWTMWLNGVSQGTSTSTTRPYGPNEMLSIGTQNYTPGAGDWLNGYIDDLRVTRGYARYTSNFTIPATFLTR